ncbi:MAG: tRNA pseudouridine(38-40) synthase TruA [Candidatus Nitricoxidivorans perseverans]|uniref:tRNA pseudouridine synthase A n=1 Tax=Candidatus Nitricoxidivorans perseverans TaxID=2975601 RepID=A0AA49FMG6_9PROT|nr:MAG: tRNA pseudouridine(38-40) synthase TruA [Candidatus Nitricoxidivorans perseverans]
MRIALGVEYDGGPFAGWQSQAHGNTVQDVLERALAAIAGAPVRTMCAGRTDAGVHALAQVVHFDTEVERPDTAWVRGVNAHLPPAVAVRWAMRVRGDFHARFSARARSYRYLLLNRPIRPAAAHGRVGWHHAPLDVGAMSAAAACLPGEHDFSAFRAAECQAKSPVKIMHHVAILRQSDVISFDFTASAFLHHMVRNLVGALVFVGKGRHRPEWIAELLEGRDRTRAAPTFDAAGLYFAGVEYAPEWGLPVESGSIILSP